MYGKIKKKLNENNKKKFNNNIESFSNNQKII